MIFTSERWSNFWLLIQKKSLVVIKNRRASVKVNPISRLLTSNTHTDRGDTWRRCRRHTRAASEYLTDTQIPANFSPLQVIFSLFWDRFLIKISCSAKCCRYLRRLGCRWRDVSPQSNLRLIPIQFQLPLVDHRSQIGIATITTRFVFL